MSFGFPANGGSLGTAHRNRTQWMLLGIALLALGALIGFSLYSEHNRIDAQERDRLQTQARVIDENLGRQMEGLNQAMVGVRNEVLPWSRKSMGPEATRRLKALASSIPGLRTIGIFDAKGMTLSSSRDVLVGRDFGEREFFKIVRARPDPDTLYVSPPFHTALGAYSINLTRAVVSAKGEFAGVVTITLAPEYFSVLLNSVLYAPEMKASIVHGDGKLVLEEPPRKDLNGLDSASPDSRYTKHVESGQAANVFANGTALSARDQRMTAWRTIRRTSLRMDKPLMVSVDRDLAGIFASWRRDAYVHVGLFGVVLVISIVGLYLLQRRQLEQDRLEAAHEAERKRAEISLRESEEKFRVLANSISAAILLYQGEKMRYCNPACLDLAGYSLEEMLAMRFWDIIHPDFQELVKQRGFSRQSGEAVASRYEVKIVRKNGEERWVEFGGGLITFEGNPAVVGVAFDISERKQAEEALRESETRYRALAETAADAIITADSDGRIVGWNLAAERMFGHVQEQIMGQPVTEVMPERYRDAHVRGLRAAGARGVSAVPGQPIALHGLTRDMREIPIELSLSRWSIARGTFYTAVVRDISERKRLEEAHLRSQKLESLGTLAGGIAHDFNNILAAIRGNADLAAEDVGPDHIAAESLQEIRKASTRASELVRRIMAFGRPKAAQHKAVDLSAVTGEVLKLLRSTLPAGISLTKQFAKDTPDVLADAGQIHEAIVNLTTNAAHAIGPRAGVIDYRLEPVQVREDLARSIPGLKPGAYARLCVCDNGCGMDATTMERVFDAFYTTKPVGEGTGLGLSMVHGIMRSHGGAVTVESTVGKGTRFALYFPVAKEKAQKEKQGAAAQSVRSAGQRVLYVDDEEALVLLASRVLTRLGHSIAGFTEPKEALAAFRARPHDFDVVVTDLSMPQMSGFELAREVLAVRPGMLVLMTTGYIRTEDEQRAHAAGIRELIFKPVTVDELGSVLDRLFRGSQGRN